MSNLKCTIIPYEKESGVKIFASSSREFFDTFEDSDFGPTARLGYQEITVAEHLSTQKKMLHFTKRKQHIRL